VSLLFFYYVRMFINVFPVKSSCLRIIQFLSRFCNYCLVFIQYLYSLIKFYFFAKFKRTIIVNFIKIYDVY
jgi:hypothetical protein